MPDAASKPNLSRGDLLRILGVSFGVAVGVGGMIGAGILRTPSVIAGELPDSVYILALWLLGGVQAALGANVLAELATALPQAGGEYVYAHRAFGNTVGLVVGWTTWLRQVAGVAALSVAFVEFLALLWPNAAHYASIVIVAMQLALYAVNFAGLREGSAFQIGTSLLKALMLLAFVVAAIAVAAPPSPVPASTVSHSWAAPIGWMAVIGAFQLIRGAYSGWDMPAYFSEENVAPSRSIPRALLMGIVVTAVLYVAVNAGLLYALGVDGVAASTLPFTTVLDRFGGTVPSILFALGAIVSVVSCCNAGIMTAPRIFFALARDQLLPRIFAHVNKGGSPDFALALMAVASIALSLSGSFVFVFGLIGILNTLASIFVEAGFFVLRGREPSLARPFRAIFYPWLPALVLITDVALLALFGWADHTGIIFAIVLAALCVPLAWLAKRGSGKTP
jgi:amino acid transporter